ncbi:hypothetical protein QE152_g10897 [Popillia japonica]|uniref:Uncharacterized protein n=1 Tax=Popillia japonica TaxID=7064 RepID=A0AAW1LTT6_POPJA
MDHIVEKLITILDYIQSGVKPCEEKLDLELVAYIPVEFWKRDRIEPEDLEKWWRYIPADKQSELEEWLPCQRHHNQPWPEEHKYKIVRNNKLVRIKNM